MTIETSPNRIVIRDGSHVVFDTNERMLLLTDYVAGSKTLPKRTASYSKKGTNPAKETTVNVNQNHVLAGIHPSAELVVGSFFVSTAGGGQGVNSLGWFSATGTYVHLWDGWALQAGGVQDELGDKRRSYNRAAYTFQAQGGQLVLNERVTLQASKIANGTTYSLLQRNFQYKLYCGTFL